MNNEENYKRLCKDIDEKLSGYFVALYEEENGSIIIGMNPDKPQLEKVISRIKLDNEAKIEIYKFPKIKIICGEKVNPALYDTTIYRQVYKINKCPSIGAINTL